MPKATFRHLAAAIADLSPRQREGRAHIFASSDQPLLQALALELIDANAAEAADLAQYGKELQDERSAEAERAFAEASIPAPPAATGPAVLLDPPEAA